MNVTRHDPDLGLTRRDDPGAIRSDEPRTFSILLQKIVRPHHVVDRDTFRDADDQLDAGVRRLHDRVRGKRRRHEDQRAVRSFFFARFGNGIEDREPLVRRSAFSRRHAADDFRSVVAALNRVECSFASGDALHDDASVLVGPDRHYFLPRFAASTTLVAASHIPSAVISGSPDLARISFPSSTFVPSSRTTTGTGNPISFDALTTPSAIRSPRMMPPKMLINIALTFLSLKMIRKAFLTCSALALPRTPRKFAGCPPASLMMSIVAIARPAPFTMQPTLPSSLM